MNALSELTLEEITENQSYMTVLSIGWCYAHHSGGFNSTKSTDFSKLGVAIGKNNHLTDLDLDIDDGTALDVTNGRFFDGLKENTTITKLLLRSFCGVGREILKTFQENNNLTRICISYCRLDNGGCCRVLTKALSRCTNLKFIELYNCNITDEQSVRIAESVSEHCLLEQFKFGNNRISNVGCKALVTALLNGSIINLHTLDLQGNNIGNAGCEALATLLRDPNCNLNTIALSSNAIDNVGATAIVSSLANNTKLQTLYLNGNQIDRSMQNAFLGLICNTSSINSTYLSNHTLEKIALRDGTQTRITNRDLYDNTPELPRLLKLNKGWNKGHVAIHKILIYHINIDMSPLFSLDLEEDDKNLKALPYVIDWFDRAREAAPDIFVERRKLSAIFQFAGAMPLLLVPTSNPRESNKRKRDGK